MLDANVEILDHTASAMDAGGLPRVVIVVTNPLDVLTEYLVRRWKGRGVSIMGSGTSLDTLRFGERAGQRVRSAPAQHPRVGDRRAR